MPEHDAEDLEKGKITALDKEAAAPPPAPAAAETKKWPASVILTLPFFIIVIPLYNAARKLVNWRAAFFMILTFASVAFCAGHFSVMRKHWIWSPDRTLGPTIWRVPIEEPLLYYWFPPLFCVILLHAIEHHIRGKRK